MEPLRRSARVGSFVFGVVHRAAYVSERTASSRHTIIHISCAITVRIFVFERAQLDIILTKRMEGSQARRVHVAKLVGVFMFMDAFVRVTMRRAR